MIYVIDDDEIMAECIARACKTKGLKKVDQIRDKVIDRSSEREVRMFTNGIEAMAAISGGELPKLIFLDILLDGPDGFTLLHELVSYADTAQVPVVVVSSLELPAEELTPYGVVGVINKDKMTPREVREYVARYA